MAGLDPAIQGLLERVALDRRVTCAPTASFARWGLRPGNDDDGKVTK
jgi:hypothetical protein